jgi:maltooligosyltrehalose trehalohydrolase
LKGRERSDLGPHRRGGLAAFTVWAPERDRVRLHLAGAEAVDPVVVEMQIDDRGWWHPVGPVPDLTHTPEVDYGFLLDDADQPRPDPRSRWQPSGVHGLSRTYDPSRFDWTDSGWTGRQLAGGVIYEMHVGTFTPEGTLLSAIDRLDHLAELGVDFVEIMPVNAFNGPHNWGYDGVLWFAVHNEYGGPRAYQRFIDACHARGLAVVQDVVYNHLGPSGNYLPEFAPYLHTGATNTWGESPNLDGEHSDEVRRFLVDNALMWLNDYHVDALRLDAVHALVDTRATHILEELAIEAGALSAFLGRPLSLIAESDLNDPRLITAREAGGYGLTAQWSDDFHHALYVSLTGDTTGYYADFDSLAALGKVFEEGFFHTGTHSSFRGRSHGNRIDRRTPTWRLVVCSDNHDQIGNRADGQRLSGKLGARSLQLAALVTLLSPFTPMIFMGEEWGATTPWQFFTSHPEPELAELVAKGRLEEFAQMDWDVATVPDPQDPRTFLNSKLDWSEVDVSEHAGLLDLNRRLLALRRTYPDLTDPRFEHSLATSNDEEGWLRIERGAMLLLINFGAAEALVEVPAGLEVLLSVGELGEAEPSFGGSGRVRLGPHSALVGRREDPL